MRKRSQKQIGEDLDLSRYLLTPPDLPDPWNSENIFQSHAPLEFEIGSGRGLFLKNEAKNHPNRHYLGVEISQKFSKVAAIQLAKAELTNAVIVCGDAVQVLENIFPDHFLEAVHIYFPDPWWKNKHSKRRIVCTPVVEIIHQKLRPGGLFHFWTDVQPYFQKGLAAIAQVPGLEGPIEVEESAAEHDFDYRTHFERRTRLHGNPVFRSLFIKKS